MRKLTPPKAYDPYDLWATSFGVLVREKFYAGSLVGKFAAALVSLFDLVFPHITRKFFDIRPRRCPILSAHVYANALVRQQPLDLQSVLIDLEDQAVGFPNYVAWGLGFPWMSKNGLYGPEQPFTTHTPYVMELLLQLSGEDDVGERAAVMFDGTWGFFESLEEMYRSENSLALSYAPIVEPRIVVNANSYTAYAYALHAINGKMENRSKARSNANCLARWVIDQQLDDGSWYYYADDNAGNFIDCFHSCFVLKNLNKIAQLFPDTGLPLRDSVTTGWGFIRENLYDEKIGLCRRFYERPHLDPFQWDLYDQAEYLGLLVDFGHYDEALSFKERVQTHFRRREKWHCRIDFSGRLWGEGFERWGIAPFEYHCSRLSRALESRKCAG